MNSYPGHPGASVYTETFKTTEVSESANGQFRSEQHKEHGVNGNIVEKADIFNVNGQVTGQEVVVDPMGRSHVSSIMGRQ